MSRSCCNYRGFVSYLCELYLLCNATRMLRSAIEVRLQNVDSVVNYIVRIYLPGSCYSHKDDGTLPQTIFDDLGFLVFYDKFVMT